jgi:hypothetical protein
LRGKISQLLDLAKGLNARKVAYFIAIRVPSQNLTNEWCMLFVFPVGIGYMYQKKLFEALAYPSVPFVVSNKDFIT